MDREEVEGAGGEGLFGLGTPLESAGVLIVPVPFEATTSYGRGTARGPAAILEASDQLDLFDLETGRPYEAGIALLPFDPQVAAWNEEASALAQRVIAASHGEGELDEAERRASLARVEAIQVELNAWLRATVTRGLDEGRLVGVLGGDHSVPFAAIEVLAERHPGLGILHVDAHADLREAYEGFTWSHASILRNVADRIPGVATIVGVGYRDLCESEQDILTHDSRFTALLDPVLRRELQGGRSWDALLSEIVAPLPDKVYVSFDIDGLDPSLCPHTGTPVPGGLSWSEATSLLRAVAESGREIVGFDLCEVARDPSGEWDQNVGARLLYKLIGYALSSRQEQA
ncbi:MAG: agmatinase family protein [Planctomycetes bacterium]|nr:agmatinase family protein [Planctomycetota bacterium]